HGMQKCICQPGDCKPEQASVFTIAHKFPLFNTPSPLATERQNPAPTKDQYWPSCPEHVAIGH
ncbi:MAG TPA: hypothetical protein PLI90_08735, partial [Rhodocyclaceae bacterium]|nr:hypothetical protein [Rhodocyclaceae bacterium]